MSFTISPAKQLVGKIVAYLQLRKAAWWHEYENTNQSFESKIIKTWLANTFTQQWNNALIRDLDIHQNGLQTDVRKVAPAW